MTALVSAVDLTNGIVTEYAPSVPTLDVPAGLGLGRAEIYVDGHGILHFQANDGHVAKLGAHTTPLSERRPEEECFILVGGRARHAYGWQVFRLSVLEA